ncbi:cysteine synthase [Iris pallida]|uniref:Cysteine synthase n=1 Tax=Iris pallida TaxID=29817 RepID=A0AAX6FRV3_IRIPA|nr:cysteine synthase [Iris pallida]
MVAQSRYMTLLIYIITSLASFAISLCSTNLKVNNLTLSTGIICVFPYLCYSMLQVKLQIEISVFFQKLCRTLTQ